MTTFFPDRHLSFDATATLVVDLTSTFSYESNHGLAKKTTPARLGVLYWRGTHSVATLGPAVDGSGFRSDVLIETGRGYLVASISTTVLIGALVSCAFIATYPRTETALGQVEPIGNVSMVYASRPGFIQRLYVSEGSRVRAGQPLAGIEVEQPLKAGISPSEAHMETLSHEIEDLQGEAASAQQDAQEEIISTERAISGLTAQQQILERQLVLHRDILTSAKSAFEITATLQEKGLATKPVLEAQRQSFLSASNAAEQVSASLSSVKEQIDADRVTLSRIPAQLSMKRRSISASVRDIQSRQVDAQNGAGYLITAPVDGQVTSIQERSGRFTDGHSAIMSIVPEPAVSGVILYVPSKAVGLLRPHQEVRLMYDAFPYQQFGSFPGEITEISKYILAPSEADTPFKLDQAVYRVKVQVKSQAVLAYGESFPLRAGMTLKATIVLERRSFFRWLFEPILAVSNRT